MVEFPSIEWMKEYCKALNANKELEEAGKGWGVGWNSDFIFKLEGIPIDSIDVEAVMKAVPEDLTASLADFTDMYIDKMFEPVIEYTRRTLSMLGHIPYVAERSCILRTLNKLVGSSWQVNSIYFWATILTKTKTRISGYWTKNAKTDKDGDSKTAFQNLKLPPPCYHIYVIAPLNGPHFLLAIGGVFASKHHLTFKLGGGGETCKREFGKSLSKAFKIGRRLLLSFLKELGNSMRILPIFLMKTLSCLRKTSLSYSPSKDWPSKANIWKLLATFVSCFNQLFFISANRRIRGNKILHNFFGGFPS